MRTIQDKIEKKLADNIQSDFLEVLNESHKHNVPKGSESHFNITVVSKEFEGKNLLAQHRIINAILKDELSGSIHALALHTYTPGEWIEANATSPQSPPCQGGSNQT
ncbi:MAG TPA: BolA/IbaG family iron-sulfur metabolism protein [Gammaproteobacteria bacterium]|nr:BolA/IbaG family iron-sulfur metabolism protein [Gammaproteobacteria bacterium]